MLADSIRFSISRSFLSYVRTSLMTNKRQRSDSMDEEPAGQQAEDRVKTMGQYVVQEYSSIGITHFVGTHSGFEAVVKQRFSDFIVHEIDENDTIVRLTDLSLPASLEKEAMSASESEKNLRDIVSSETYEKMICLSNDKSIRGTVDIDVTQLDKEGRTRIHKSVSQIFPSLSSFTKDASTPGVKLISISRHNQYKGKAHEWKYPHAYTHFTAYQENRGTIELVNQLCKILKMSNKSFQYAGTKDKRGISSQQMSCFKLDPKKLMQVNDTAKYAASHTPSAYPIAVGNICFRSQPLKLGMLNGNHFKMVLREVIGEEIMIEASLNSVKDHGFVNYFGTQRFGNGSNRTDVTGRLILKQDWKGVIESILSPKFRDMHSMNGSFNQAMKKWHETRDAKAIFANFKWKFLSEGVILRELAKYPDNYKNALLALPRNSRCMYVHGYQSYVWNRLVSLRIKEHGLKVVLGDLVILPGDQGDRIVEAAEDGDEIVTDAWKVKPVVVTADVLPKASIYDVVIPLPGSRSKDSITSDSYVESKMREILAEDGIGLEDFTDQASGFTIYGGYRKMLIKPKDMIWSLVKYNDETKRLFRTDLECLQGIQLEDECINGKKTAVMVEFSLPPSSYATMCAREFMKR